MKVTVRQGTFETNSSSTHTLAIYKTGTWKKFEDGELYFDAYQGVFYTEEEIQERYSLTVRDQESYPFDDWMLDEGIYTFDRYSDLYEILTEEIEEAGVTAVSIFGYE